MKLGRLFPGFLAIAAMVVGLWAGASFAQEALTLEPEVVTGSRIYQSLKEVPAATYVVTTEDIERSGATELGELLSSTVPGIYISSRNGSTQEDNIKLRGIVTEVLVLMDGVPYYKASNVAGAAAYDLRSIPLEDIERIEVVKGAGSALYGSMAAAGVINIITKKPLGEGVKITGGAGTNDWREGSFSGWTSEGDFSARVWYGHSEEGESRLSWNGTVIDKNLDYDQDSGGLTLKSGPFTFSGVWGKYTSRWTYNGDEDQQKNDYSRFYVKWEGETARAILYRHEEEKEYKDPWSRSFYDDISWGAEFSKNLSWRDNLVSWGMSFRNEKLSGDTEGKRKNYAPFIEISRPVGDFILNAGLRYEIWDQDNAKDYKELNPKLSLSYQTLNGNLWYLSAGRFFAMPSFYEIAGDGVWVLPNPDLKPEKGYSYELGVKGEDEDGPWSANMFYMDMEDKIVWSDLGNWTGEYDNVNKYRAWGLELSRRWKISSLWDLELGATWMRAEEKKNNQWERARTPEWDVDASFIYTNGPLSGQVVLHYLGNRNEGQGVESNVTTVDASLEYKGKPYTIRLSAYNIFDEDYWASESWGTYYYGPERRAYLTLEYQF
ncbi:TonB-dependent receptor plug [Thermovirga lienii DSM 17291]|uniref:TonB-dependent receptor plug n=1 Tax=Thermovirga lienii (strain ATCC BAA-1197 / DSM 17291 / Cas60314) TaxID=580340 RepID=G7V5I5_THELD|nr:TonB-dependent receptor [Thermovirga lienii]AER65812.1 TonB-dependent receptor plug [Thermovirga lienii DSM 17291]